MENLKNIGIITSRICPTCGHHEIGYISKDGEFHPLKQGEVIQVLEPAYPPQIQEIPEISYKNLQTNIPEKEPEFDIWVPEPLKRDLKLSMKYGVFIEKGLTDDSISGTVYQTAFLDKLVRLIDAETAALLPVLLDQYFSAPYLAIGSPKQIAENLLQELDEFEDHVRKVREWIEKRDMISLEKMIHPQSIESLNQKAIDDDQIRKGLEDLTLETYFEILFSTTI